MSHADTQAVASSRPVLPSRANNATAIRVRGVGKSYQIYGSPRDRLKQFLLPRLNAALGRSPVHYYREFSALDNVSFDVDRGETVGIIGRNGAGKSTLLQIICGTLTPTSGTVEFNGRVAALLELGSGFNGEFTGRENVRMNAGLLGLSAEQVDARFDDIVAFADIGEFLDQPVKTYSSGMAVRLAFAVVVHVDADILIVDEALSVGDLYFQAKCMAHMKKLMEQGVTVLFVSHDLGAVKTLCNRAIYLDHGRVAATGPAHDVIDLYYAEAVKERQGLVSSNSREMVRGVEWAGSTEIDQAAFAQRAGFQRIQNGKAHLLDVFLMDDQGRRVGLVDHGQMVTLRMLFIAATALPVLALGYHVRDRNGYDVAYSDTGVEDCHVTALEAGDISTLDWEFTVPLRHGDYTIAAGISIPLDLDIGKVDVCDFVSLATTFQVGRGQSLPIYGAVHWKNRVTHCRLTHV